MRFTKMNGAGNDFIILDCRSGAIAPEQLPAIARALCDRRMSIGADGLMAVVPAQGAADYGMLFFNSDGSRGEMCGNGARCICRYGYEKKLAGERQRIETTAGLVTGARIDRQNYRIRLPSPSVMELDVPVAVDGAAYPCAYVELGEPGKPGLPHAVVEYPGLREADEAALFALGRSLRYHPAFARGANVNFFELTGENQVYERTWERGVEDFTYACGSGTGSVAAALTLQGRCTGRLEAQMRGGTLYVDVEAHGGVVENLYLTGPTIYVCEGEVLEEALRF